jgi:poly-gamma-glutamate capsule biosynthesis protein CapA/YwtB (metallophosphatase superfamily)
MPTHLATVFLCGDVMTGRGIDQIMPHPSAPDLHEPYIDDAKGYVALAESVSGAIPRSVPPAYIWGDALEELERERPDVRLVNLETSITRSDDWEPKGINYRMHPDNIGCLTAAGIDVAVLANNHVLDWGVRGLTETITTLGSSGIEVVGAGANVEEARRPVHRDLDRGGRLVVHAFCSTTSGVPRSWAATANGAGVDLLNDLSKGTANEVCARVRSAKGPSDVVVASIHWGGNWDFSVPEAFVRFAHWLIDGGVDLVHGHSSHHVRPIEVYDGKLILYGCGDFISDYEGITGYEEFRNDLVLMYFATLHVGTGELLALRMVPMQLRGLRLRRPSAADVRWLAQTLDRIGATFGSSVEQAPDDSLMLRWRP